ncbi:MAG: DUF2911 domain-containing protein [Cytophagales bacterium]|nr:MAG: DUF2911 domain-containing protein [Cytophagales bacterium]
MKKISALLVLLFATFSFAIAQNAKPAASPRITAESPNKNIKVVYGQPSKLGRVVFGPEGSSALEKFGKPWRTGANEATEVTFKNDVMFGGKHVKAGTYTLVTMPGEKEWSVVLNSTLGQWGAYEYEKNKANNVAEVKAKVIKNPAAVEKLTITPANASLTIAWDNMTVSVPLMDHGK